MFRPLSHSLSSTTKRQAARFLARTSLRCLLMLSCLTAQPGRSQMWWDREFTIGMWLDPPIFPQDTALTRRLYTEARDAGFSLLLGIESLHSNEPAPSHALTQARIAGQLGMRFLAAPAVMQNHALPCTSQDVAQTLDDYRGLPAPSGFTVRDEPSRDDSAWVRQRVEAVRQHGMELLPYVNLLPRYGLPSDEAYTAYLRTYLADTSFLPVVSFDHYQQDTDLAGYLKNLQQLRRWAGRRPLWSFVRTAEATAGWPAEQQEAYVNLGCFAPLAYGAKGILYFTYDKLEPHRLMVDESYHTACGWDATSYFNLPREEAQYTFFAGYFDASGVPGFALHNDASGGTWRIKRHATRELAQERFTDWDLTLPHQYGTRDGALPLLADADGDGIDDLMTLRRDGQLFIDYGPDYGSWDAAGIALPSFPQAAFASMDSRRCLAGQLDGSPDTDVVVSYEENGKTFVAAYWDCTGKGTQPRTAQLPWPHPVAQMLICPETGEAPRKLMAWGRKRESDETWLTQAHAATLKTERSRRLQTGSASPLRHLWLETHGDTVRLYAQDEDGNIHYGDMDSHADEPLRLTHVLTSHSALIINAFSILNRQTGSYTMYGKGATQCIADAILDSHATPTRLYDLARRNNSWTRQVAAPILLEATWKGCWFADETVRHAPESGLEAVGTDHPLIASIGENMMTGLLQTENGDRYLFIVNTSLQSLPQARLSLKGDRTTQLRVLPRLPKEEASPEVAIRTDAQGLRTDIDIPQMGGGECVILHVQAPH